MGATDGIGKGFCLELAKQGMNIVLVSRNLEKLRVVAKEIEERFDVKTKVVDIDFSKDKDAQSRLETETGTLDISILSTSSRLRMDPLSAGLLWTATSSPRWM